MNELMKPVREETQRERALFSAALRVEGTALTQQGELEISVEMLSARKEADALAVDNERLRKLIKSAEWDGQQGRDAEDACPWCGSLKDLEPHGIRTAARSTYAHCPAFTPEGEVR